ncbi:MAG TPA: serine/threonine-protein kinase, partial [Kofleriaceae bacterium]|nr:serine/threonine-protein kinase [Kofleriaceae bacterium]
GTTAPVDWQLATLVPEHVLFDATQRLGRQAIIASAAALFVALGVALMFAWNLVRMRRTVVEARAEARSARERAQQLGSYRLVAKLGAGGMGEVWRAEHQLLARQAAIKLVRHEVLADPKHATLVRERFKREAQTVASLRSRHTIELYDYGVADDGSFFFVMELLDGLDLAQLVREHGPQPAARVISILAQACASLAEAHDAGLLHRDIKPANLFLSRAADEVDIVKLLDFGIAHNVGEVMEQPIVAAVALGDNTGERLTVEGSVIGTPGYIPPEQAVGAQLDARGDLYALGCVAWWLLTGAEVYPNVSGDDLIRTHVTEPIPELRVRGWLPAELERLVVQCLAKEPARRPHDARALADALLAIVIPPEHAWTKAMATAWWQALKAGARSTPEAATVDADAAAQPADRTVAGKIVAPLLVPLRDDDVAKGDAVVTVARPGRAS